MSEKKQRIIFIGVVVISFLAIFVYNVITPPMSDDLLVDRSYYQSLWDVFREQYHQYMDWSGRAVLLLINRIFCILPKWIFNIFNSLCFVYTGLLIYWNIDGRKKYDALLFVLIQLLLWNFSVEFDQTVLWVSGACNYLWGVMIILSFITLYRHLLALEKRGERISAGPVIALAVSAFLAGWGNENTSGGAILIVGILTALYVWERKRIERWMIFGLAGALSGFAFLLLAPGNAVRGAMMTQTETYTGLAALISRGLKVFKAIDAHLLVYLVVICLLGTWYFYQKRKLNEFRETAIFAFAALATAGVLILTPEPMPRAYYGANIYMMIAALMVLWKPKAGDRPLLALRTGGILAGLLIFSFTYIEEGANLVRILREVNEREEYILEQTAAGNYELRLPMLRPQFESEYSFMYESDISQDEEFWINDVFCIKYGLTGIEAVPREDWTEY